MSKVAISGNASGTGTFTIQSPATNTDRVLTLPDEAGTVLTSGGAIADALNVDSAPTNSLGVDASGNLQFNSGYGSVATAYGCRAWANVSGDGTASIRDSGGVSSLTDNGTGDYTLNLSITLPDTNGAVVSGSNRDLDNDTLGRENSMGTQIVSTTAVDIVTGNNDGTIAARDYKQVSIAIFR